MARVWARGVAAALVGLAAAMPASATGDCPLEIVEVAAESGLRFTHERGGFGARHLPETMGAGLAWLDYDGDGWLDLYLVQSGPFPPDGSATAANRLFRNLDGRGFEEVAGAAGAGDRGYGQGALAADFDGDGDPDLAVLNYGADALLRNDGRGRFVESGPEAGLGETAWSSSAAAGDADGDGDLDLYITRYVVYDPADLPFCGDPESGERRYCDPSLFVGAPDRLLLNRGDGTFTPAAPGVGAASGRGLGVVFTDLDGDSLPDLYVANDLTPNFMFRNLGGGRFEDLSLFSGAAVDRDGKPEAGMGIAVADFDRDGDPDLVVTNFDVETNTLYRNLGAGGFADESAASGLGPPSFNLLGFGIAAEDFDGDGRLDLLVGNGHIFERPNRDNTPYRQREQLLLGTADGFREARCAALEERPTVARALGAADFDNDGDPDAAVQQSGGPAALYRVDGPERLWVGVDLAGAGPNTGAVGARLELRTSGGSRWLWRLAGDSYQSSSDPRLRFTVGRGEAIQSLEVAWPGGGRTVVFAPPAGRYLRIREPVGGEQEAGAPAAPR